MIVLGTFKSLSAFWCRLRLLKSIFGKKQDERFLQKISQQAVKAPPRCV